VPPRDTADPQGEDMLAGIPRTTAATNKLDTVGVSGERHPQHLGAINLEFFTELVHFGKTVFIQG